MKRQLIKIILVSGLLFVPGIFRSAGIERSGIMKNYQVRIAQESYLVINGFTNINEFACGYQGSFFQDTLTVDAVPDGDHLLLNNAELKLRTTGFDCRNDQMNMDFKELLHADRFPYIVIKVLDINNSNNIQNLLVQNARPDALQLSVNVMLAGKENDYTLPVEVRESGDARYYLGHVNLDIRDFGIDPPKKMFGLVRVNEMISIDFMVRIIIV